MWSSFGGHRLKNMHLINLKQVAEHLIDCNKNKLHFGMWGYKICMLKVNQGHQFEGNIANQMYIDIVIIWRGSEINILLRTFQVIDLQSFLFVVHYLVILFLGYRFLKAVHKLGSGCQNAWNPGSWPKVKRKSGSEIIQNLRGKNHVFKMIKIP